MSTSASAKITTFMTPVHDGTRMVTTKLPVIGVIVSVGHLIVSVIQTIVSGVLSLIALIFSKSGFEGFTSLQEKSVDLLIEGVIYSAGSLLNILALGVLCFCCRKHLE